MKWTHATGLLTTCVLIGAGGMWAGCSSNGNGEDGGADGAANDVNPQQDTATGNDTGTNDTGTPTDASTAVDANALDCAYYCATDIAVCTGNNNQYKDNATCMSMCQAGIPNDVEAGATSGNSLACRMYHLSVAAQSASNAAIHCPHTGPYGYGMCGDLCTDFCEQYFTSICKTDQAAGYATQDACRTYCNQAAGADAAAGAPGNLQTKPAMLCREYHLENAVQNGGNGGGHCDHAGEGGAGVCP